MQYSSVGTSALSNLAGGSSKHKRGEDSSPNSFAQLLSKYSGAASSATGVESASSSAEASTTDPATAYQESLKLLRNKIDRILSKLDIEANNGEPINVQLNANGELAVTGDHPRINDLKVALNSEPGLRDLFVQVANQAEQIAKTQNPDGVMTLLKPASADEPTVGVNLPERFSLQIEGTQIKPQMK